MEQIIVIDSATRTTLNSFVTSIYFYYKSIFQQRREVISIYLYSAICISGYRYRHKIHNTNIEFKYKLKKRSNCKKRINRTKTLTKGSPEFERNVFPLHTNDSRY